MPTGKGDLISRKALLEQIDQQRKASKTGFPKQSFVVGDAINCIRNAPEVKAEPIRRGRWEYYGNGTVSAYALCSMCGCGLAGEDAMNFDYCPYCGAKMN